MQLAIVGLGRMGANMARRLVKGHHEVVVYNRSRDKVDELAREGAVAAYSLKDAISKLDAPRVVWLMLPAGDITEKHILELRGLLESGDIIVEGGNSNYKDDVRRFKELDQCGISYLDAGVSGGIWGLDVGYCTMVGGEREAFEKVEPVFKTLAPEKGYLYCGHSGAGHFVKMVHNGVEYGMMQAYAEGFEILKAGPYGEGLNMGEVSQLWNQGSVVRSWLLELCEDAFKKDPELSEIRGFVEDSGEGRWTVQQAIESGVPAPVITASLFERFRSRMENTFTDRVLAAMRKEFGGHAVIKEGAQVNRSSKGAGPVTHSKGDKG